MYLTDLSGLRNHTKEASGRLGFSRGSGSERPNPAGFFSASSPIEQVLKKTANENAIYTCTFCKCKYVHIELAKSFVVKKKA